MRYEKKLDSSDRQLKGVSASPDFSHRFNEYIVLSINGELRRAYNYANALMTWQCETNCGTFSCGLFCGKVWGKNDLPTSTTGRVELGFVFGPYRDCTPTQSCRKPDCRRSPKSEELIAWIANPAVYIPAVLVVSEQNAIGP